MAVITAIFAALLLANQRMAFAVRVDAHPVDPLVLVAVEFGLDDLVLAQLRR